MSIRISPATLNRMPPDVRRRLYEKYFANRNDLAKQEQWLQAKDDPEFAPWLSDMALVADAKPSLPGVTWGANKKNYDMPVEDSQAVEAPHQSGIPIFLHFLGPFGEELVKLKINGRAIKKNDRFMILLFRQGELDEITSGADIVVELDGEKLGPYVHVVSFVDGGEVHSILALTSRAERAADSIRDAEPNSTQSDCTGTG